MKDRKAKKIIWMLLGAAFLVLLWFVISKIVGNRWIFPSPAQTFEALGRLSRRKDFYIAIAGSLLSVVAGFVAGNVAGLILGVLSGLFYRAGSFLKPGMALVKATPVASFIVLILIWLGKKYTPAVTSFLIVLPVVWQNVVAGIRSADKKLLEAAKVFRLTPMKKMRFIYMPAAAEGYVAAVRTSMGFAWKAGVAAEVLSGTSRTLGGSIYRANLTIETPELFAYTVVVVAISLLAETAAGAIAGLSSAKKKRKLAAKPGGDANG